MTSEAIRANGIPGKFGSVFIIDSVSLIDVDPFKPSSLDNFAYMKSVLILIQLFIFDCSVCGIVGLSIEGFDVGSNTCSLQWGWAVLTTGPPGKSLLLICMPVCGI